VFDTRSREDGRLMLSIPRSSKPRAEKLNETLLRAHGGKMHNPKDISRSKEKMKLRNLLGNLDDE
jgi:hypothetical protein